MKRFLLISLIIALTPACSPPEPDFRKASWGMSKEQIIALEGEPIEETEFDLIYNVTVEGVDARCAYVFFENKLKSALYTFDAKTNGKMNLIVFSAFESVLEDKYGAGENLKLKPYTTTVKRETDRTIITHEISQNGVFYTLHYKDKNFRFPKSESTDL